MTTPQIRERPVRHGDDDGRGWRLAADDVQDRVDRRAITGGGTGRTTAFDAQRFYGTAMKIARPVVTALCVTACSAAIAQSDSMSCAEVLADLNVGLQQRQNAALLAAAALHETGRCVKRDDAAAAQYLGEAARNGSRIAALKLARKFGRGWGVKQSYANCGAWVSGKGATDEPIEAWDYSIGYASTVLRELLAAARYPSPESNGAAEFAFVVEIDALDPSRLVFNATAAGDSSATPLAGGVERALRTRLAEVLTWLAPPDRRWLVAARVAAPVTLRYESAGEVLVHEGEPILR